MATQRSRAEELTARRSTWSCRDPRARRSPWEDRRSQLPWLQVRVSGADSGWTVIGGLQGANALDADSDADSAATAPGPHLGPYVCTRSHLRPHLPSSLPSLPSLPSRTFLQGRFCRHASPPSPPSRTFSPGPNAPNASRTSSPPNAPNPSSESFQDVFANVFGGSICLQMLPGRFLWRIHLRMWARSDSVDT